MANERHALLVATNIYEDPALKELRAPAGDASALREVLADPSIGDFHVREPLIDRPSYVINEEIEGFFCDADLTDLLLLYVSCHGVRGPGGRLYFATRNTKMGRLFLTAVGESHVNNSMGQSRARSIVLMLDCCHSGAFRGSDHKSAKTNATR